MIKRSDLLASIVNDNFSIAIAGTHGKTTITAILSHIMSYSKLNYTAFIGGVSNYNNSNLVFSIKKNLAKNKISQMKEAALKEIKDTSIRIAVDSVKKIISTSVDKSKLDNLFEKNLEEAKTELKKINS